MNSREESRQRGILLCWRSSVAGGERCSVTDEMELWQKKKKSYRERGEDHVFLSRPSYIICLLAPSVLHNSVAGPLQLVF